ncbi:ecdysone oxidase [Helicoverpa armigera]|uniref:ecdysone oxidase n=1 Tax=Helicoverpa armigera TaxID=29058 RepID=UPI003082DFFC
MFISVMADATNTTLTAISAVQSALAVLYTLQLTEFRYPSDCSLTNATTYDYIVVGAGSAGSVVANRLSANSSNSVLLIEAGSYPPWESELPELFTPMPKTDFDWDTSSVNDGYSAQNLQDSVVSLTQGKMIGGSSNIGHMIHVQGDPHDYNQWASLLNDDTWTYENLLPFFKKLEQLTDVDLLATSFADLHGTDGMIKIEREIASISQYYLNAFAEAGHTIVNDTTSATSSLGATNPLFTIGDNLRQSSSIAYLAPAKSRTNLCMALSTTATKVLVEDGAAVGVQVTSSSGDTLVLYANKEVIVSAGAIHTPKLLMLSGIGPQDQLEALSIPVVADLPVGQNLMDHPSAVILIQMEEDTTTTPAVSPYKFPVPTTTLYATVNSSQTYPDYQAISLVFPHDSGAMMQLCANSFKYNNAICNIFAAANVGRTVLYVVHNLMMPKSYGNVTLASTDPTVEPIVYTGTYTNADDLSLMAASLADFMKVMDSTYFTQSNATFVDTGLCSGLTGTEYWECYALGMSATMWHYSGTCAMGSVVDSTLKVKGIDNLRVVDASVMPTEVSGNINAAVTMIGERGAALILADN